MPRIRLEIGPYRLDHDRNYGAHKRTGWSAAVNGAFKAQFVSLFAAVWALARESELLRRLAPPLAFLLTAGTVLAAAMLSFDTPGWGIPTGIVAGVLGIVAEVVTRRLIGRAS